MHMKMESLLAGREWVRDSEINCMIKYNVKKKKY